MMDFPVSFETDYYANTRRSLIHPFYGGSVEILSTSTFVRHYFDTLIYLSVGNKIKTIICLVFIDKLFKFFCADFFKILPVYFKILPVYSGIPCNVLEIFSISFRTMNPAGQSINP